MRLPKKTRRRYLPLLIALLVGSIASSSSAQTPVGRPPESALRMRMRWSRPAGQSAEEGSVVGSSSAIASAIPRFSNGLAAIDADSARSRQQAFHGFAAIALLDAGT